MHLNISYLDVLMFLLFDGKQLALNFCSGLFSYFHLQIWKINNKVKYFALLLPSGLIVF